MTWHVPGLFPKVTYLEILEKSGDVTIVAQLYISKHIEVYLGKNIFFKI